MFRVMIFFVLHMTLSPGFYQAYAVAQQRDVLEETNNSRQFKEESAVAKSNIALLRYWKDTLNLLVNMKKI